MTDPLQPPDSRSALKRTGNVFFGRFGRLLPIQEEAIPPLREGRDALLCAPTAAGKTEAAFAPLLERLIEDGARPGDTVYIAPTRALINDMDRRITGPCASLSIGVAVRTGDRRELKIARPPQVLLTTPESLDSLLCRAPRLFSGTRRVIADEIHQLDGNYRGDQLRVLLRRLADIAGQRPQTAALSATVADPEAVAARWLDRPAICRAGAPRPLDLHLCPSLEEAVALLRAAGRHKAVLFCNRRADVETLAADLAVRRLWPADAVFVHHGSLPRPHRERTERTLRERSWGLCVATMTLELGMDIGDISAVVLYGPPPTAAAFQQRIGRACRREGRIFLVGVAADAWEETLFRQYAAMAGQGEVESRGYAADLSVVVQQLFSILFAHPGGLDERRLLGWLAPLLAERPSAFAEIADHLEALEWLERRAGVYRASTRLMDLGERGVIHSNIPDSAECQVVDADTGEIVARAFLQTAPGAVVALSGRIWEIVSVQKNVALVRRSGPGPADTRFVPRGGQGAFRRFLPEHLR